MDAYVGPARYRLSTSQPASSTPTELTAVSTPSAVGAAEGKVLSLSNPLAVFGLLAAATFGLMAFGTSVRVGKTTASLNIGDTK